MPDEVITPVAEQTPDAVIEPSDQEVDESSAFLSEEKEPVSDDKQIEAEPKPEAKEEEPPPEPDESDTDDDVKRGEELLAEQQKAEEERKAQEESQRKPQAQGDDNLSKIRQESIPVEALKDIFAQSIPTNLFPKDPVEINGVSLDFQNAIDSIPELPMMITVVANNLVRQMVESGYLVSSDKFNGQVKDINSSIDGRLFDRTVMHPEYGVPNAMKILDSPDFKKWAHEQPPAIKALFSSSNPYDVVKGLKRFVNNGVMGEAKASKETAKQKAAEGKKKFDAIHKAPTKKGATLANKSGLSPEEEERLAFESDDDK